MLYCSTALLEVLPEWPDMPVYSSGPPLQQPAPAVKDLEVLLPRFPKTALKPKDIAQADMNDSFLLIYTSGTTGLPKAAKMTHAR